MAEDTSRRDGADPNPAFVTEHVRKSISPVSRVRFEPTADTDVVIRLSVFASLRIGKDSHSWYFPLMG